MKKTIFVIATMAIMVLMATSVMAARSFSVKGTTTNVVEKDPVTWQPVVGGANGKVQMTYNLPSMVYRQYRYRSSLLADNPVCPISYNVTECADLIAAADVVVRNTTVYQQAKAKVYGLPPKTEYQLIYYGDAEHNDEWPYATCIGESRKTSTKGYVKSLGGKFIPSGAGNQKLWVVPASDVDCELGIMTAWNPSNILFEIANV